MNNGNIAPGGLVDPSREVLNAAGAFLEELCRQYPRIAGEMAAGVRLTVSTAAGARLVIEGGRATPAGLVVPFGGRVE